MVPVFVLSMMKSCSTDVEGLRVQVNLEIILVERYGESKHVMSVSQYHRRETMSKMECCRGVRIPVDDSTESGSRQG